MRVHDLEGPGGDAEFRKRLIRDDESLGIEREQSRRTFATIVPRNGKTLRKKTKQPPRLLPTLDAVQREHGQHAAHRGRSVCLSSPFGAQLTDKLAPSARLMKPSVTRRVSRDLVGRMEGGISRTRITRPDTREFQAAPNEGCRAA